MKTKENAPSNVDPVRRASVSALLDAVHDVSPILAFTITARADTCASGLGGR